MSESPGSLISLVAMGSGSRMAVEASTSWTVSSSLSRLPRTLPALVVLVWAPPRSFECPDSALVATKMSWGETRRVPHQKERNRV